jgi:hypothetical protein
MGEEDNLVYGPVALSFLQSVPEFHSFPGAAATLYLDFDGHFEAVWGSYTDVTTPVYDRDGDPTTFNAEEVQFIEEVWRIVAEDFAPFNINVTTVEPPVLAEGVPSNQANGLALRISIGGTPAVLGKSDGIGGTAYVNSFTTTISNVAYVFPEPWAGVWMSSRSAGTVSSHEAGHSFGLRHVAEGPDLAIQWHPIMYSGGGSADYATWATGPDEFGNHQDDMAVLANSLNGFGYRNDDHADTPAGATPLAGSGTTFSGTGIISTTSDVDVFSITTSGPQSLRIEVQGSEIGQNLNAIVEFLDATGGAILYANPLDSLDAEIFAEVNGTAYVAVRSTGEYGRVGQYAVSVTEGLPGVRVQQAATTLSTTEAGVSDTFHVMLNRRPLSDVVIDVASSDPSEGTVSTNQLTFTPANWYLPQTVTVTGVDDHEVDGVATYGVHLGPVSSADSDYDGLTLEPLAATNADDDIPGWVFQLSAGEGDIFATDMKVDPEGNLLITGRFSGTVDFDPDEGVTSLTPITSSGILDGFIAKYTPAHELIWVKRFGGSSGTTYARSLALDGAGNVYLAGDTSSTTANFGSLVVATQGSNDAFLTKVDASGNFLWVRSWGSSGLDQAMAVAVDANDQLHVIGTFSGNVDLDPGAGTFTRTSSGSLDSFVSRFNSSGNFLSATILSGPETVSTREIAVDAAGNEYVVGHFFGTAPLGSQTLVSGGGSDPYLLKISPAGNVEWARQAAGVPDGATLNQLALGDDDSVTFVATFRDDVNFGVGTPTLTSAGDTDIFLTKWDAAGNLMQVGQISGPDLVRIVDLQMGPDNSPHLIGHTVSTVDFDPGPGVVHVSSQAESDFVLRLTSDFEFVDVSQIVRDTGITQALALDARGNIFVTGRVSSATATMPTGDVISNDGGADAYVFKLSMAPGIVAVSALGLQTSEDGSSANFSVSLETPPTADVTIAITSSDSSEGIASPSTLTFTPANWNQPQTVTVTGVNDGVIDGNVGYALILGPASSSDPQYDGLTAPPVAVTNLDNDEPIVLFEDSFEVAEWNGLWVEDNQNDWFRSTQRATNGTLSAEVDGPANNALLTLASPVDLTVYSGVELTFSWFIESSWDAGEYLALDLFNGNTWNEVRILRGNVDQENVWHNETVTIDSQYLVEGFKLRFRAKVSGSDEDGNVDNIELLAYSLANQPPVAANEQYLVDEDGALIVGASGVLANDSDPDGDPLTATLVNQAGHGVVALSANGSFTYTPNANFFGFDSFTYRASDGASNSNVATVAITVMPVNDVPVALGQSVSIKQNIATAITLSGSDVDGDALMYTVQDGPSSGTLTGTAPNLVYTPTVGFIGDDSFTFQVHDGSTSSNVVTVYLSIDPNGPPVAASQNVSLAEDSPKAVTLSASDADGDSLTYSLIDGPTHGILTGTAPNLVYTPAANFYGSDSFTFQVYDGTDVSNIASVAITITSVNDAPVANPQQVTTNEDSTQGITLSGSDIEGDALTYAIVSGPAHGSLSGTAPNLLYTPGVNFNGSDSFTFRVNDGSANSSIATVTITVNPINDAPVALGDSFSASAATTLNVAAPGVLGNDSDPDGDGITAVLVSGATQGVLSLSSNGSFAYTPNAGASGADSFTYYVTDGQLVSSPVAVTIDIVSNATKFYVLNDATVNQTYEYDAGGNLIENYAISSGNSAPRGAASTAAGTTVWVADKNRKVFVYDVDGGLLGSWTAGTLANNAGVEGLATNGTDVWIVDSRSDKVFRYSNAAGRLSGSQTASSSFSLNSGNSNPKGIVTDGVNLWVVNDASTDKVFKYTLTGSLVGSWTMDSANQTPTGLTIDPTNGSQAIWIVDSGTDRVYEYADGRTRTSGNLSAAATFGLAPGNTNPQGIADPPAPTGSQSSLLSNEAAVQVSLIAASADLQAKQSSVKPNSSHVNEQNLDVLMQNAGTSPAHTLLMSDFIFSNANHFRSDEATAGDDVEDTVDLFELLANDLLMAFQK